jgi:nucleolar GTP-binding protein
MSNITKQGIENVKSKACDILLDHRLTQKAKDPKKAEAILNRLHVAEPKKRDNAARPEIVPDSVRQGIKKQGPTVVELQEEFGGAGNFHIPVEEHYMLENEEWRYDKFPEFYNGSNVLDYYDPDITKKLNELEREEEELLKMEGL